MPLVVIKPDGVWDTRSPLRKFTEHYKRENQIYWSLLLTLKTVKLELSQQDGNTSAVNYFNMRFSKLWDSYKNSFGKNDEAPIVEPTTCDVVNSIHEGIFYITEQAIVSYLAEFESFIYCWTLNYLLTKLEIKPYRLTDGEVWLVKQFRPNYTPAFHDIFQKIPVIEEILRGCPHVSKNPKDGKSIHLPVSSRLNAYNSIFFWRKWRNLLVHNAGVVSKPFFTEYKEFWNDLRNDFANLPLFKLNEKFKLNEAVFTTVATVHPLAARRLRNYLVKLSQERRGHTNAPNPQINNGQVPQHLMPKESPKMFLPGDHQPSYNYYRQNYQNTSI